MNNQHEAETEKCPEAPELCPPLSLTHLQAHPGDCWFLQDLHWAIGSSGFAGVIHLRPWLKSLRGVMATVEIFQRWNVSASSSTSRTNAVKILPHLSQSPFPALLAERIWWLHIVITGQLVAPWHGGWHVCPPSPVPTGPSGCVDLTLTCGFLWGGVLGTSRGASLLQEEQTSQPLTTSSPQLHLLSFISSASAPHPAAARHDLPVTLMCAAGDCSIHHGSYIRHSCPSLIISI